MSKFSISYSTEKGRTAKGFAVSFANGWTVSVQFGRGNYCDNSRSGNYAEPEKGESPDAEIAAWPEGRKYAHWYNFGYDEVKGYLSSDEVLAFMNEIAALAPGPIPVGQKGAARQAQQEEE